MQPKTLKVRAKGEALVQNLEDMAAGIRSFVGRRLVELEDRHGFEPVGDVEVPNTTYYRQAIAAGDLEAADEATAKAAGVAWKKTAPSADKPAGATKEGS